MKREAALKVFVSLSSGVRLDAFRLLVEAGPDGMVAGEIAAGLDIAPTNLSFHLKALIHAGLLNVVQEGRFQRYRANIPRMLDVISYLTDNCCRGQPELCATLRPELPSVQHLRPTIPRKRR